MLSCPDCPAPAVLVERVRELHWIELAALRVRAMCGHVVTRCSHTTLLLYAASLGHSASNTMTSYDSEGPAVAVQVERAPELLGGHLAALAGESCEIAYSDMACIHPSSNEQHNRCHDCS